MEWGQGWVSICRKAQVYVEKRPCDGDNSLEGLNEKAQDIRFRNKVIYKVKEGN